MAHDLIHPAALGEAELLEATAARRQRRSGPGGQHRNKVETAVVLTHLATGIQGEASERRSQEQNRRVALFRLRVNLALRIRLPRDAGARPSRLWQSRCRFGRVHINPRHRDFPAMLAEALDVIAVCQNDIKAAADRLECSTSQLTRLLQAEPRALALVNEARRRDGLHQLR